MSKAADQDINKLKLNVEQLRSDLQVERVNVSVAVQS